MKVILELGRCMFCQKKRLGGLIAIVEIFKQCHVEDKLNLFCGLQRTK